MAINALPTFGHRNYSLFWCGQFVSLIGTQIQMVALGWLMLRVSNSPFYVGLLPAFALTPVILFSLFSGILADRVNKRKLLAGTQTAFLVQAFVLAALVSSGFDSVWTLLTLAAAAGTINAVDAPVRQSFVPELVPEETLVSAIALNAVVFNGTRVIGPAVAGFMIHAIGESGCFYVNAVTYLPVIAAILMMRESELFRAKTREVPLNEPLIELREGFAYVHGQSAMKGLLFALAVISFFSLPMMLMMPVFARDLMHVGAKGMGWMSSAMGGGALVAMGFMAFAKKRQKHTAVILGSGLIFGASMLAFSVCPSFALSLPILAVAGAGVIAGIVMINTTLQLLCPARMRGRIMGMFTFVVMGMAPPGGVLLGWASERFGARSAVAAAGVCCLAIFVVLAVRFPDVFKSRQAETKKGRRSDRLKKMLWS